MIADSLQLAAFRLWRFATVLEQELSLLEETAPFLILADFPA